MSLRGKLLLLLMLGGLAAGFFYLRVLARRMFFELPQHAEEAARARLSEVALQSRAGPSQTATLYFPSLNDGRLVAESRPVAWAEADADRVRQVLLALVEGSHQGLGRVLPPATNLRAVFLSSDGTAYVDFSNDLLAGLTPGITSECATIYSIVNSISTNVPIVKKVKILIQGQEVDTLDGHVDLSEAFVPDPARIQTAP
jgi:spore germination protein GerM